MSTAVTAEKTGEVARPLRVLVPLIKEDLRQADDAADRAAMPFYKAAGHKLLEANEQISGRGFDEWIKRNFDRSRRQAERWMGLARADEDDTTVRRARQFTSLREFSRELGGERGTGKTAWHEPVKKIVGRVDTEALNRRRNEMKRVEEREEQRKLGIQLIDIGYKVLAAKLHPDKGGSRDAMARLNQVRDRLKQHA